MRQTDRRQTERWERTAYAIASAAQQEKLTNCWTKAGDVLANLLAGKLKRESSENVGAFATAMTSQRLSIQNVAPSATVWP